MKFTIWTPATFAFKRTIRRLTSVFIICFADHTKIYKKKNSAPSSLVMCWLIFFSVSLPVGCFNTKGNVFWVHFFVSFSCVSSTTATDNFFFFLKLKNIKSIHVDYVPNDFFFYNFFSLVLFCWIRNRQKRTLWITINLNWYHGVSARQ